MSSQLILPSRFTRQPQTPARLDWSNPRTAGLVFCAVPTGETFVDLVTGVVGERVGTVTRAVRTAKDGFSKRGDGVSIAGSGGTDYVQWPISDRRGGKVTTKGAILALGGSLAQVAGTSYPMGGNTEVVVFGHGFALQIDSTVFRGAGYIIRSGYNGVIDASGTLTVGNPFDNRTHFFGYSFNSSGANGNWYAQRAAEAWSGGPAFGTTTGNRRAYVLTASSSNGAATKSAYVLMLLIYNREVSLAEYQSLYDNPWQIFRAPQALPGVAAPAGGAFDLAIGTGSFTLTGQNAGLAAQRNLAAGVGSFTLTGIDAGLAAQRQLAIGLGSFVLSGQAAALAAQRRLAIGTGPFVLSGQDVTLTAATAKRLAIDVGAFVLNGQAVALTTRRLTVGTGAFVLTGKAVTLTASSALTLTTDFSGQQFWRPENTDRFFLERRSNDITVRVD